MLQRLAKRLGYVRQSEVNAQLQFARSVGKRLDEHREVVEAIDRSGFFVDKFWHVGHMSIQDDYLMRLYHMVYGCWPDDSSNSGRQPTGEFVRPRPQVLDPCCLPEYRGTRR